MNPDLSTNPESSQAPSLSVLILTRNRRELLSRVLQALVPQLSPSDQVCILDTGSNDGTPEWLDSIASQLPAGTATLHIVRAPREDLDFAAARNRLVQSASGTIAAFIDDDCVPEPDWAASLRHAFATDPDLVAAGGIALAPPNYRFPDWWTDELNWTVGLSGPDLIAGLPGAAPSTSNLAIRREAALIHPFGETCHSLNSTRPGGAYHGMREDAHWWLNARLRGDRLAIIPACRVTHYFPTDRLQWKSILHRAELDGRADWNRRPSSQLLGIAVSEVSDLALRHLTARLHRPGRVWLRRQWGVIQAAREISPANSAQTYKPLLQLSHAVFHRLRQRIVRSTLRLGRNLSRVLRNSVSNPTCHAAILAPGFVGDTVLLQPALRALADVFAKQGRTLTVWVRWPELLGPLPSFVRTIGGSGPELTPEDRQHLLGAERLVVPYYHFGCRNLYRRTASRCTTFDWDVGFSRLSDPWRADKILTKDPTIHEVENLCNLLAELQPAGSPPLIPQPWNLEVDPHLNFARRILPPGTVLLFPTTGHPFKDWPLDRWATVAVECRRMWNCPVALIASGTVADELHSHLTRLLGHAKPGNNDILLIPHAPTMSDLIALIQAAGLVLSGCTGPKHIAHALGVPTVCLYGRTEPHRWGAYFPTDRHTIIQSPGADLTDFELAGMPPNHVMTLITIDQVLATLSTIQPDPFPQTLPPG